MIRWDGVHDPDPEALAAAQTERVIQKHATEGLTLLGFIVCDMSQGRETQQKAGIADLYLIHLTWRCIGWCEIKVPLLLQEGVAKAYTIRQRQGQRRYEQEEWQRWHRALEQPCIHAYTVDSADEAIAYWAWAGYPVPRDMYRRPYRPEQDVRFYNPKAKPHTPTRRGTRRKNPQRVYQRRRLL